MNIPQLRERLKNFQFQELFVEGLGWENPTGPTAGSFKFNGNTIHCSRIAEISGVPVLQFTPILYENSGSDRGDSSRQQNNGKKDRSCRQPENLYRSHFENSSPDKRENQALSGQGWNNNLQNRKQFHKEIKKQYNKHLLLFSDKKSFFTLSYLSKEGHIRTHEYFKGQSGDYFISKLSGIHFGIEDEPKITDIGQKLEKSFDTETITKKFYQDFKSNHFQFQKYILGIKTEEEKKWYASLILNRLMFIWFLQKKGFVNSDFDYLQTKLTESKNRGKDRYYQEFLTLLFFEGFAKKPIERSPKAKELLGEVKYLNGGLFVPHALEEKYGTVDIDGKYKTKIKIQDKAFEKTFEIFNQYDWCLEGSSGQSDSEISPDVMGYIFEKYINELQQKSLGAYYTRDEITGYLSRNAVQKAVLEKAGQAGYEFQTIADMLHNLKVPLCKRLLTDEDSILNTLTVLDPAVGSGAFLTSAMKELIDIYSPLIGKMETLGDRDLKNWLEDFKTKHKSVLYGIKKNIILKNLYGVDIMKEAVEVCKLRLFLSLVSSALSKEELEPLPNMDFNILCGNSLIGFLRESDQEAISAVSPVTHKKKPLQLDNSSHNFSRHSRARENPAHQNHENSNQTGIQMKWSEILGEDYNEIKSKYNKLVHRYKNQPLSFAKLKELKSKTNRFLKENSQKLNRALADKCNEANVKYPEVLDIQGKKKKVRKRSVRPEDFYSENMERNLNPFHWDFAFNEIMDRGGFDVIITNPPWEKVKIEDKEFFGKYDSTIQKNKTKKSILDKKKTQLLKNSEVRKKYLKIQESYHFQRGYFFGLYNYQTTNEVRKGKEQKSKSIIDTYQIFTERCLELLNNNGFLGIVLPSGLCRDDGAIGLRKDLLFRKCRIEGLIDFQNQMDKGLGKIFERVDSRFKFLLLNLQKANPQDEFPCQFMERNLTVLDENQFPKNPKMRQSIKEIKKLSPKNYSIIEFKNPKDKKILKKACLLFPAIGEKLNDLWNLDIYSAEFNGTDFSPSMKQRKSQNCLPLYKGSAIYQYQFNYDLSYGNRYINAKTKENKGLVFHNELYKDYRLIFRKIARNTDERSLISTVIPKNCFILDGLYEFHIESKNKNQNHKYMLLLQSFLNSFIVDYLIRQKVSASINKKYITPLPIPRLTEKDDYFKELVERSAKLTCIGTEFDELADEVGVPRGGVKDQQERRRLQGEIDAIVAYIYNLSLEEFEYILSTFTTGKNQERLKALKQYALEAFKKDKFLNKVS